MNRPAIPLSRCVKCTHYNGTMCVLEDLAPCQFRRTPEAERGLGNIATRVYLLLEYAPFLLI